MLQSACCGIKKRMIPYCLNLAMKCRVCNNTENNLPMEIKEMQHCTKESFIYFQCGKCECIQIDSVPEHLYRYYPSDYYSFNPTEGNQYLQPAGFFKRIQAGYLIRKENPVLGRLFTIGYQGPRLYDWLQIMQTRPDDPVLDIGCGSGFNLKQMNHLGYRNLTGVDPFIHQDYFISPQLRIYKLDPLNLDDSLKYQCIMMHHSFEHMVDEKAVLEKAKKLLLPGGKILIRIPVFSKALMNEFGTNLVSLDAPRHIFIHSEKSMDLLCRETGLKIEKVVYDADESSYWASEQYSQDICLFDECSYGRSRERSIFSKKDIKAFRKHIASLNRQRASDTAAFYISSMD